MTVEEAAYHLAYHGEDEIMRRVIAETITRLPEEAAAFALDRCYFASVGRTCYGMTLPGRVGRHGIEKRTHNMWFILLDERLPAEDAHGLVAHEIAHALLKHDRLSSECPDDCETQAAKLTRQWDFSGKGADADYCNGIAKEQSTKKGGKQ